MWIRGHGIITVFFYMSELKPKGTNLPKKKKGTKPVAKQTLYQVASAHSKRAIERLCELMESRNENVALGAAKALLNKALPDLRVTELQGNEDKPIGVVVLPSLNETTNNMETTPRTSDGSPQTD